MKEITLDAVKQNIPVVTDFINEFLEECECSMKAQMQIDIAVDEIFCNIASYAYGEGTGKAEVTAEYSPDTSSFTITFADEGVPYNPLEKDDPDVTLSAEERQIGGLGIFMVKKIMDDMTYRYENGKNVVTIVKKIK